MKKIQPSSLPCCIINTNPENCNCILKEKELCNITFYAFNDLRAKFYRNRSFNEFDIEEILSQTYYSILKNIEALQTIDKYKNWLYKIAKNKKKDFYRNFYDIGTYKEIEAEDGDKKIKIKNKSVSLDDLINTLDEIDEEDNKKQNLNQIIDFLNQQESYDKTNCISLFLELLFFENEDMQLKDLANSCCIKPNTLTKRLSRCRETVKNILDKEGLEWN